jgi:hypothetical protein
MPYSTDKLGVRIAVNLSDVEMQINKRLENIKDSLKAEHYKVDYDNKYNPENWKMSDGIGFEVGNDILKFKRKAFKHEDEYRFSTTIPIDVIVPKSQQPLSNTDSLVDFLDNLHYPKVIYYELPVSMIKEIILDPRASQNNTEMFIAYCNNRGFIEKNIDFRKSDLYNPPLNKYYLWLIFVIFKMPYYSKEFYGVFLFLNSKI